MERVDNGDKRMTENERLFLSVARLFAKNDIPIDFMKLEENGDLSVFVLCNDMFYWGCADCEKITQENYQLLEKSFEDISGDYGALLFVARLRKMRPQGAYYKYIDKERRKYFDECGPERPVSFSNPVDQNSV